MIADTCVYFPPTCWMTLAYSFSAPMATILLPEPDDGGVVAPADEQALASRATPSGTAAERTLLRMRIAGTPAGEVENVWAPCPAGHKGGARRLANDNHFYFHGSNQRDTAPPGR